MSQVAHQRASQTDLHRAVRHDHPAPARPGAARANGTTYSGAVLRGANVSQVTLDETFFTNCTCATPSLGEQFGQLPANTLC